MMNGSDFCSIYDVFVHIKFAFDHTSNHEATTVTAQSRPLEEKRSI